MKIGIRKLEEDDINIYQLCYKNDEFKRCIFGDKNIDVRCSFGKLLEDTKNGGENYIVLYNTSDIRPSFKVIGFCNFLKYDRYPFECPKETYAFNGGILPQFFNSGYGIYACVSMMTLFFYNHPDSLLYASTFHYNKRSTKMLLALGFERFPLMWYGKNHFVLDKICFSKNDFVSKILSRIEIIDMM